MTIPLPEPGDTNWYDWAEQTDTLARVAGDPDMAVIAALDSSTAGVIASDGGGWIKKTYAQIKTAIGLPNVANLAPADLPVSDDTQAALDNKAAATHSHGVGDLTASGTKDGTTFLRGDNTWAVPPGSGGGGGGTVEDADADTKGVVRLAGDFGGTADDPEVVRRAPVGGVQTPLYSATITPDASEGVHQRYVIPNNLAVNPATDGEDGQELSFEVQASGGDRTVTFAVGYEVTQAVPGRVFTVPSGTWAYFKIKLRSSTWRLIYAEPQTVSVPVPSAWVPADHGLLAWTADPCAVNATGGPPTDGHFMGSIVKLDQPATISNIICGITTAGSGFTASRNFAGLYSVATGVLLGSTADQASTWNSTGAKTMLLGTPLALPAGFYLCAVITTATVKPVFAASAVQTSILNFGRLASSLRSHWTATAYTSMPSFRPDATGAGNLIFFGLS